MLGVDALLFWAAVAGTAAVVLIALTAVLVQQGRRARERSEHAQTREEMKALDTAQITLEGRLHPKAGPDGQPLRAPIEFTSQGANLWVHEVRFSWRFKDEPAWSEEDAMCELWQPGHTLPVHLPAGPHALEFAWPGAPPARQAAITHRLQALCSVERSGPVRWLEVGIRQVAWQEAE